MASPQASTPPDWPDIYARYNEAVRWLESLITDPGGQRYLTPTTQDEYRRSQEATFARTTHFLDYLGNPQNSYMAVHIAGTGGKGSVASMVGEILLESGVRSGLHTSPYLQVPNEKFVAKGRMVSPSGLTRLVEELRPVYERYVAAYPDEAPRYLEASAALLHLFFRSERAELAAVETGMGGRFDPTNVLNTQVAIITNIDFDHVPQLGTTLPEIAWHKAGIIKPGKPVVTGEAKPQALVVIEREAREKEAPLYALGREYRVERVRHSSKSVTVDVHTPFGSMRDLAINLVGGYQALNAGTAVMAAHLLRETYGLPITEEAIWLAMRRVRIAGRMEVMQREPTVIIDGAHNPQKMRAAAQTLADDYPQQNKVLVVGMLKTKDAATSLREILPHVSRVIATEPHVTGKPSIPAAEMAEIVRGIAPGVPVEAEADVQAAIRHATGGAGSGEMVFVTGSIYMLGQARELWHPKMELLRELEYGPQPPHS